ncbi:hypothetical protein Patl1_34611 [Pistacia atlantica]|uniref:Uncharacterized protein n=1 Tax=Pistacia atlantica TaxID=434234 RepID=A0ACC0ZRH0_9ROSI|nr:hypothetical protein Patl1_34611 [Pistacia atlantica]
MPKSSSKDAPHVSKLKKLTEENLGDPKMKKKTIARHRQTKRKVETTKSQSERAHKPQQSNDQTYQAAPEAKRCPTTKEKGKEKASNLDLKKRKSKHPTSGTLLCQEIFSPLRNLNVDNKKLKKAEEELVEAKKYLVAAHALLTKRDHNHEELKEKDRKLLILLDICLKASRK